MNKTNRCTEFQFYWYDDSTCFRQSFCPSSGVLSRTSALVHYMQLWWPYATRSRMAILLLVANGSSQLHKMYQSQCTAKNSWWWAERLPKTCRVVIPIKLEFRSSVGLIHRESVTMHGHMILKDLYAFTSYILCKNQMVQIHDMTWYHVPLDSNILVQKCWTCFSPQPPNAVQHS